MIVSSPEIWHRDDFPILCNWRKLWRVVEVGVDRGVFAEMFLDRWVGHFWRGIDDYRPYPEMPYDREADCRMALDRISPHASRAKLIRLGSVRAAQLFEPGSVDFIYIDGAHDRDNVRADLGAWYPALSEHGILAGHDWTDQPHHAGVKQAVTAFASRVERDVYLTSVEGYQTETCPSWYLYKSGMPSGDWRRC